MCAQLCPTLCNLKNCSPPGYSVHRIFQARILEWVAISFSMESSQPRDWTWVFLHTLHWRADSLPLCQLGKSLESPGKLLKDEDAPGFRWRSAFTLGPGRAQDLVSQEASSMPGAFCQGRKPIGTPLVLRDVLKSGTFHLPQNLTRDIRTQPGFPPTSLPFLTLILTLWAVPWVDGRLCSMI